MNLWLIAEIRYEIEWFIHRYRWKNILWQMQEKFQRTRYDYFVYALDFAFRHGNLFEHGYLNTIKRPIIQYGDLRISRTNRFVYEPIDGFVIKILTGYGYFFVHDHLFLRTDFLYTN